MWQGHPGLAVSDEYRPRDPARVSANMARIRRQDSKIERRLGSAMWGAGLRYRKQYPVEGRPDFAFPGPKVAVFCDSEFWHGAGWGSERKAEFRKNAQVWISKIERTMQRDREVDQSLTVQGWTVLRFWGKDIQDDLVRCVQTVRAAVG